MPVQITINNEEQWLFPTPEWKTMLLISNKPVLKVDRDFYVNVTKL
jgi:hypothetical protein